MDDPIFTAIAIGQWQGGNNKLINHSVYGLCVEGKIHRFTNNEGWIQLTRKKEGPVSLPSSTKSQEKDDLPW